jgi:hypothetical protein
MCEGAVVVKRCWKEIQCYKNVGKNYSDARILTRVTATQFFGKSAGDTKIPET